VIQLAQVVGVLVLGADCWPRRVDNE